MSLDKDLKELKELYKAASSTVASLRASGVTIFPPENEVLNCFSKLQLEDIKVVILGQDPYHGAGQAHGYSFSVKPGIPKPPSLQNIFKELKEDLGIEEPTHGNLVENWEREGVLLLNKILTVEEGKAKSHRGLGWEEFTAKFIEIINNHRESVVFILWGREAQEAEKSIDINKHMILKAAHPSPLSANRGFFGCKHFSKTNEYLEAVGKKPINWEVD